MKALVTQYHALRIRELTRGDWLDPFSKYDWVWRTDKGTQPATVTIMVLMEGLQVMFPTGDGARARQEVRLTYSLGPQGGKRTWFSCPTCRRRVGVLYHANGLRFRCRICCGLAYPSQYKSGNQSYGRHHREQERQGAKYSGEMMISRGSP